MKKRASSKALQLAREKALFKYSSSLERGDFETVVSILHDAEHDPVLEQMIVELSETYSTEYDATIEAGEVELVRQLIHEHLGSAVPVATEDVDIPPLTVGDVLARLKGNVDVKSQLSQEVAVVAQVTLQSNLPLPSELSQQGVRRLFQQLEVSVSKQFQRLFRETALFLSMGRQQGVARLAAARRQQHPPESQKVEE